jgi:hypothetical protein
MPPDDKTLALSFSINMLETRGILQVAVPATVATAHLRKLSADWAYRKPHGPAESKEQVKNAHSAVPVSARTGSHGHSSSGGRTNEHEAGPDARASKIRQHSCHASGRRSADVSGCSDAA